MNRDISMGRGIRSGIEPSAILSGGNVTYFHPSFLQESICKAHGAKSNQEQVSQNSAIRLNTVQDINILFSLFAVALYSIPLL